MKKCKPANKAMTVQADSAKNMEINDTKIPYREEVRHYCIHQQK